MGTILNPRLWSVGRVRKKVRRVAGQERLSKKLCRGELFRRPWTTSRERAKSIVVRLRISPKEWRLRRQRQNRASVFKMALRQLLDFRNRKKSLKSRSWTKRALKKRAKVVPERQDKAARCRQPLVPILPEISIRPKVNQALTTVTSRLLTTVTARPTTTVTARPTTNTCVIPLGRRAAALSRSLSLETIITTASGRFIPAPLRTPANSTALCISREAKVSFQLVFTSTRSLTRVAVAFNKAVDGAAESRVFPGCKVLRPALHPVCRIALFWFEMQAGK